MNRPLKYLLLCAAVTLGMLLLAARGAEVTLEWNASPGVTVTGYRVYIGTNGNPSSNWVIRLETAGTNVTWNASVPGREYWACVTATNNYGLESEPSNIVPFVVPEAAGTLRVKMALMQSGSINGPWEPVNAPCWEFETPIIDRERELYGAFYRAIVQIEMK